MVNGERYELTFAGINLLGLSPPARLRTSLDSFVPGVPGEIAFVPGVAGDNFPQ